MANEINAILRLLIERQQDLWSIRKISITRKINYKSAYHAVAKLEKEGILSIQKIGNTKSCSFNLHFNPRVLEVEYLRREELVQNKNFKVIYNDLKRLAFPFIALLFGSYAKGTQTKHSDIDLLIIAEQEKEISSTLSIRPLNIHSTIIKPEEFMQMAKSKEFSVVSEALKKNIILIGIEDYYRLLENAQS